MSLSILRRFRLVIIAALALLAPAGGAAAQIFYFDEPFADEFYEGDLFLEDERFYDPPPRRRGAPRRFERAFPDDSSEVSPRYARQIVANPTSYGPGTIVVDTRSKFLYLVLGGGRAIRYGIGVGREGFGWRGVTTVGRKAPWPDWRPPAEMRARQPHLPVLVKGGPDNPLGARALYLYRGKRDTLYRIHGTNERWSIGRSVSSGCFRMLNEDVVDLYRRVPVGTRVVVL